MSGATPGNQNRMRHGLMAGTLPAGCSYIRRETDRLRKAIERAILDRRGVIELFEAAAIQSVIRWERHALLAQRWLRTCPELTIEQKLNFSRETARASSERDKSLRMLGLDRTALNDPWSALDAECSPSSSLESHSAPASAIATPSECQHSRSDQRAKESVSVAQEGCQL